MEKAEWSEGTFTGNRDGIGAVAVTVTIRVRGAGKSLIESGPEGSASKQILVLHRAACADTLRRERVSNRTLNELHTEAFYGNCARCLGRHTIEQVA